MADGAREIRQNTLKKQGLSDRVGRFPTSAGTVHAQPTLGTQQRWSLRAWWLSVMSLCLMTSCVVLPPTADPLAAIPAVLSIRSVTPPLFTPFTVKTPHVGADFHVENVATQSLDPASLHYYWYLDWDNTNSVLDVSAVCQSKPTCTIVICDHANKERADHTLLAVVSSAAQLETAVTPTDFPPDTVYDAVEWRINNVGSCQ